MEIAYWVMGAITGALWFRNWTTDMTTPWRALTALCVAAAWPAALCWLVIWYLGDDGLPEGPDSHEPDEQGSGMVIVILAFSILMTGVVVGFLLSN